LALFESEFFALYRAALYKWGVWFGLYASSNKNAENGNDTASKIQWKSVLQLAKLYNTQCKEKTTCVDNKRISFIMNAAS